VITPSRFIADEVPKSVPSKVVPRPVSSHSQSPRRPKGGNDIHVVGVVGQISRDKKTFELLVELAQTPSNFEIRLRGGAHDKEYLNKVLSFADSAFGSRFKYDGVLAPNELMNGLDYLACGNPHEPMGRVVIEAQLSSVIVFCPSRGGNAELVDHLRTGMIADLSEYGKMVEGLIRVSKNAELQTSIRKAARTLARGTNDPQTVAQHYWLALFGEK
jgi:glycosyltransferase involved in cell wall biosynthesis